VSQKPVPLLAVVLRNLRVRAGWTQVRLEREACLSKGSVCRLEKGDQAVDRFQLGRLAMAMGIAEGDVERAIAALEQLPIEPAVEALADLPSRDRQTIETVSSRFSRNVREKARQRIESKVSARRWRLDRAAAATAWQRLRKMPDEDRRRLVEEIEAFHTWAVVERLCEESTRAASNDVDEARNLAQIARLAAARMGGAENGRRWLEGFAAAFEGNAWRVAGDHQRAHQVFSEAAILMGSGSPAIRVPVDRTRPLSLHAALLTDQNELDSALVLLDEALSLARTQVGRARVLIYRADVLRRRLEYSAALEALAEARLLAQLAGQDRLLWAIAFNEATYLCEAGDAKGASARLAALQAAALAQGGALDQIRLLWLKARIAAASGYLDEASSVLREVWEAFAERRVWIDAGLAILEFAGIELERGQSREVKQVATAAASIFAAQILPSELLASIRLFWDAARREEASAQSARALLQKLRQSAERTPKLPDLRM